MTVIKFRPRPTSDDLATAAPLAASERHALTDDQLVDELASILAVIDRASVDLTSRLTDIVSAAIHDAFGEIGATEIPGRAIRTALERFGHGGSTRLLVHPADVERVAATLVDHPDLRIEADPLRAGGEIVLDCLYGRLHLGARQLALALTGARHD